MLIMIFLFQDPLSVQWPINFAKIFNNSHKDGLSYMLNMPVASYRFYFMLKSSFLTFRFYWFRA